jgi:hypothetical protein
MPQTYLHSLIGAVDWSRQRSLLAVGWSRRRGEWNHRRESPACRGKSGCETCPSCLGFFLDRRFIVCGSAAGRSSKPAFGSLRLPAFSSASTLGLAPAAPAATASAAWRAFREDRSSRSRHFLRLVWSRLPRCTDWGRHARRCCANFRGARFGRDLRLRPFSFGHSIQPGCAVFSILPVSSILVWHLCSPERWRFRALAI